MAGASEQRGGGGGSRHLTNGATRKVCCRRARDSAADSTPVVTRRSVRTRNQSREGITLRARLFTDDYRRCAEGEQAGADPVAVGTALADHLMSQLR